MGIRDWLSDFIGGKEEEKEVIVVSSTGERTTGTTGGGENKLQSVIKKEEKKQIEEMQVVARVAGEEMGIKGLHDWQKSAYKRWDEEKIKEVQEFLGLEPTGKVDDKLADAHEEYFLYRYEKGEEAAKEHIQKYSGKLEMAEDELYQSELRRIKTVKNDISDVYQEYLGITPTAKDVSSLMPMAQKANWSDVDIYNYLKGTPEFQKRWPGIPDDMTPKEYDNYRAKANQLMLSQKNRPLTDGEYQNMLKGIAPAPGIGFQDVGIMSKLGNVGWGA